MTHTYAVLEVTEATFREIKEKLEAAGYQHAFDTTRELVDGNLIPREVIDMHGIAVSPEKSA